MRSFMRWLIYALLKALKTPTRSTRTYHLPLNHQTSLSAAPRRLLPIHYHDLAQIWRRSVGEGCYLRITGKKRALSNDRAHL